MKRFGKYLSVTLLASGLSLGGLGLIPPDTARNSLMAQEKREERRDREERHPHIHRALEELREARREIKNAGHDFKGHREEAVEAIDRAIRQLERLVEVERR